MRLRKNTLNNMTLDNLRKDRVYQAIITDLALTGNISRSDAEMLLGYEIPEYLKSPEGDTISSWDNGDDEDDEEEAVPAADEVTEKSTSTANKATKKAASAADGEEE